MNVRDTFFSLITFLLGFIFLSVLPSAPVIIAAKRGETDIFVYRREKRFKFFLTAIISYVIGALVFIEMGIRELFLFLACYATVTSAIMLSTFITKTSVHTAGYCWISNIHGYFIWAKIFIALPDTYSCFMG